MRGFASRIEEDTRITDGNFELCFNAGHLSEVSYILESRCIIFNRNHVKAGLVERNSELQDAFRDVILQAGTDKFTGKKSIKIRVQRTIIYEIKINNEARYEKITA
jgi:hypothetical protein